ncbi:MAG: thiamine ABC transporter substrate-binding protein [Phototrophicaceae bacterium]
MKRLQTLLLLSSLVLSLIGTAVAQDEPVTITLITHDSFNVSTELIDNFQAETGIVIDILRAGDAGQVVNQSVLSAGNPLGDVLFGVDNTFLSRALNGEIFLPYESPLLENVNEQFILDEDFNVTPISYGDVCINYDIAYFEDNALDIPESLADLTSSDYEGLLVVENPATSSPGLAFLMATVAEFGEVSDDNEYSYLDFWTDLVNNNTLIAEDWSTAYYGNFTQGSEDGTYPLVVSYASSPPFSYSEDIDDATTASIVADGTCFRQIEFAGILDGTEHEAEAQQVIDWMLSVAFQEEVPDQMYVFPVNNDAELPELFAEYAQIPDVPADLDYASIEENRDMWIQDWLETVLD